MSDKNKEYTATFSLTQQGLDGMVTPILAFNPEVEPDAAPAVYEYMSHIAMEFLRQANVLDEDNQIVDEDMFDRLQLDLTTNPTIN